MEEEPSDRCGDRNLKSPKVEAFQPKVFETMSPPMAHRRESQARGAVELMAFLWCLQESYRSYDGAYWQQLNY